MDFSLWVSKASMVLLMVAICLGDLQRRRVDNALSLGVAAVGLVMWLQVAGPWGVLQWTLGLLLGFAMLAVLYGAGLLGGADVKVFAAFAAVAGVSRLPTLLLASMLAAGVLSVVCLVAWHGLSAWTLLRALSSQRGALERARRTGRTLPLTVALVAALVVTLAGERNWAL